MTPEKWLENGQYIKYQGHQIFYKTNGNIDSKRPTILMIHGYPTSSWDFETLFKLWDKKFNLVAPDMLNFGFSAKPRTKKCSVLEQADVISYLIEQLNLPPFHILAHDYGDTVAQELMARHYYTKKPESLLSVCMLNGGLFPETHRARFIQILLNSPLGSLINQLGSRKTFDTNMRKIWGDPHKLTDDQLKEYWDMIHYNNGRHLFHSTIYYMTERKKYRPRWLQALTHSKVPIALINGSLDPVSGKHMVERYRELVGDSNIYEIPESGHYPHLENPDQVSLYYQEFLASLEGQPSISGQQGTQQTKGEAQEQKQTSSQDDSPKYKRHLSNSSMTDINTIVN
ncbi:MAG: alpha/beta hydrolase [Zetaproteobacteria bacterium]|nr:alpha/beta hydrolase [Pseudobdellovibrionaceae bacterium]